MTLAPQSYLKIASVHRRGPATNRPLPDDVVAGTLYFSTDTGVLERSTGAVWEIYSMQQELGLPLHAITHGFGGTDPIYSLPSGVSIQGDASVLNLYTPNAPVDMRIWRFVNYNDGAFRIEAMTDALAVKTNAMTILNNGNVGIGGTLNVYSGGASSIGGPTTIKGKLLVDADAAGVPYVHFEVKSSGHPEITFHNPSDPADSRKGRVLYYQQRMRFDYTNDAESAVNGSVLEHSRVTGNLVLAGGTTSGIQTAGPISIGQNLSILSPGNNPSLYLYDPSEDPNYRMWRIMNQDSDLKFYSQNDDETGHIVRLRLDRDGGVYGSNFVGGYVTGTGGLQSGSELTVASSAYIGGNLEVLGSILSTTSAESAYFRSAQGYVRTHWNDNSQAVGSRTFVIISLGGRLYLTPTDDAGLNPIAADWSRALSIDRNGSVITGAGGLYVTSVVQGAPGLNWGWYQPVATNQSGLSNWTTYWATYIRVGNVVHVSGKFDALPGVAVGTLVFLTLTLPIPSGVGAHGGHYAGGTMCGNNRTSGTISFSNYGVDIYWTSETTANYGYYYTYSYAIV